MKKFLIALPLVLIMILSMIPVMAADVTIDVNYTFLGEPDGSGKAVNGMQQLTVSDETAKDEEKLQAAADKFADEILKTHRPDDRAYKAVATVTVAKEEKPGNPVPITVAMIIAKNSNLTKAKTGVEDDDIILAAKYESLLAVTTSTEITADDIAKGTTPDEDKAHEMQGAAKAEPATVSIVFTPQCFSKEAETEEPIVCKPCTQITVIVKDAFSGKEIESIRRKYDVKAAKIPNFKGIFDHYMANYFPHGKYQIVNQWYGQDIKVPTLVNDDCEIVINVIPVNQAVDVFHELYNCCKEIDGEVNYTLWKTFYEENVQVPFLEFITTLVVNQEKAAVWASTRLQKINAMDFVFQKAIFDDGIRIDSYMEGTVRDMNNNVVAVITNELPKIRLIYYRAECVEGEEQVDNATVDAGNTTAPATGSAGAQLPATGAKDVSAFFLSAVALLGLGVFFAKKH